MQCICMLKLHILSDNTGWMIYVCKRRINVPYTLRGRLYLPIQEMFCCHWCDFETFIKEKKYLSWKILAIQSFCHNHITHIGILIINCKGTSKC